jgi:hypothetical protein
LKAKPKTKRAPAKTKRVSKGEELLTQVIRLTGIPSKNIKKELKNILEKKNIDPKDLTLDQLRCVVASYLREIMSGILERQHSKPQDPRT